MGTLGDKPNRPWPRLKELQQEIARDLLTQQYRSEILTLDDHALLDPNTVGFPKDAEETRILKSLKARLEQSLLTNPLAAMGMDARPAVDPDQLDATQPVSVEPIFEESVRLDLNDGEYHYYQPVYWKKSCSRCHIGLQAPNAFSAAEAPELMQEASAPFRVVKVIMPYEATQSAVNSARAILVTAAIALVATSMIALWLIVKYVIVKPLKHLRDVSENISRGDNSLRAEINTNDEFAELAASFNKMLHSLTEKEVELRKLLSNSTPRSINWPRSTCVCMK